MPPKIAQPPAAVDPKALMDEATNIVKQQAFQMKRAFEQRDVREGLEFCVNMLCELRTGQLSAKQYHELYVLVTDQMRYLESHFYELWSSGRPMSELYEMVQHCGNTLPRVYLLIAVGSVYIKSKEAPAKEILKDLVQMCLCVQDPIRGLFVRNYLLAQCKSMLPDIGSDFGSNYEDSMDFLIQNFCEMSKMWVRWRYMGTVAERSKREAERHDVRILIGMNLVRLSQLEGISDSVYAGIVLPKILAQVTTCKDEIAQQYLMETIIQVFPDEFHVKTLAIMLECISGLQAGVDLRLIFTSFMDRLASFVKQHPEAVPADLQIFDLFHGCISKISNVAGMNLATAVSLQAAMLNLSLSLCADRVDQANTIIGVCSEVISGDMTRKGQTTLFDSATIDAVVNLLQIPLTAWSNPLSILELAHYPSLLDFVPLSSRKKVSISIVDSITKVQSVISTPEQVDRLFTFIAALVVKQDGEEAGGLDAEKIAEEQNKVASLVHLIQSDNTDILMQMYLIFRRHIGMGGPLRMKKTLPPLIFRFLMLAQRVHAMEEAGETGHQVSLDKLLRKFIMDTTNALASVDQLLALRTHLMCALTADKCGKDDVAYDMLSESFVLYEDEISDSKEQVELVTVFTGTLRSLTRCTAETYNNFVCKTTQYAAQLLKKTDQIPAICRCSHLFWNSQCSFTDGKRTMDCLRKSGNIAESFFKIQSSSTFYLQVGFYLQILERYLYFYNQAVPGIEACIINELLERVQGHMSSIEPKSKEGASNIAQYCGILSFIQKNQSSEDDDTRELFAHIWSKASKVASTGGAPFKFHAQSTPGQPKPPALLKVTEHALLSPTVAVSALEHGPSSSASSPAPVSAAGSSAPAKEKLKLQMEAMGYNLAHINEALQKGCGDIEACIDYISKREKEAAPLPPPPVSQKSFAPPPTPLGHTVHLPSTSHHFSPPPGLPPAFPPPQIVPGHQASFPPPPISDMSPKVSGLAAIRFPLISASDVTALPHFAEFRGGNGVVRQVMYHGNLAAMKKPNVTLTLNARDRSKFVKELEITYAVKHTACVQMLGACLEGDLFLLLEWMEGGSLYDALGNHADRPVLPRVRLSIARNVADGLEYLHSCGIVHRDIKSLNILLTSDMRAKLCDFGLATPYFAPELFHGAKSSEKSDIYAFGVVLWELLTCDVPFDTLTETQVRGLLERSERPVIPEPLPSGFPPEYAHLIRRCWHQDPAARPTAREALAALVGMDPRSHINGPVQLYPDGHSIPPFSTLLSLLTTAMPGAAAQPLLQQMTQYVTDVLAKGKEFVDATKTHGLMPLEAHCIAAYTLDARSFGCPREDSPFFVYNAALRSGNAAAVDQWSDFSCVFDCGLKKLPPVKCTVYRGLDCPLTEVSHLYTESGIVWNNSVTSTTTDKSSTLAAFGSGVGGRAGTFLEMRVVSARSVKAFSAFPSESELLLAPNTCMRVLVALASTKAALLQGLAQLPANVDLAVLQEEA